MTVEAIDGRLAGDLVPEGATGPQFQVSLRRVGTVCILALRGDLHAASVGILEAEFDRLAGTSCRRVVVDVTGLTDLDATGRRVLTGLSHYVHARGGAFTVIGASAVVAQALAD